jgi:hypothetical protein
VSWLNLLIIAAWGMLAAQFVIQACLFLVLLVFALIGFIAGAEKLPRSNNIAAMAVSLGGVVAFTLLFVVGLWLVDYLQLAPSGAVPWPSRTVDSILFWVCFAFSLLYILPQLPTKPKNGWRDAMHKDAMLRRAFENAKN